jgi:hypothetical protein
MCDHRSTVVNFATGPASRGPKPSLTEPCPPPARHPAAKRGLSLSFPVIFAQEIRCPAHARHALLSPRAARSPAHARHAAQPTGGALLSPRAARSSAHARRAAQAPRLGGEAGRAPSLSRRICSNTARSALAARSPWASSPCGRSGARPSHVLRRYAVTCSGTAPCSCSLLLAFWAASPFGQRAHLGS